MVLPLPSLRCLAEGNRTSAPQAVFSDPNPPERPLRCGHATCCVPRVGAVGPVFVMGSNKDLQLGLPKDKNYDAMYPLVTTDGNRSAITRIVFGDKHSAYQTDGMPLVSVPSPPWTHLLRELPAPCAHRACAGQRFGISAAFVPLSGLEARCCSTVYSPEVHGCPLVHGSVPHDPQTALFLRRPSALMYQVFVSGHPGYACVLYWCQCRRSGSCYCVGPFTAFRGLVAHPVPWLGNNLSMRLLHSTGSSAQSGAPRRLPHHRQTCPGRWLMMRPATACTTHTSTSNHPYKHQQPPIQGTATIQHYPPSWVSEGLSTG